METTTNTEFKPQEVAYYLPGSGKGWTRKIVKTERAMDKLIEKLNEQGAVIETRDAEGY